VSEYTSRKRVGKTYRVPVKSEAYPYRVADSLSADYVYSWRSRKTDQDLNDVEAGTILGVKAPKTSGNVFDVVADRTRFLNDLDATAAGSSMNAPPNQQVTLTGDTGHRFTSVKWRSLRQMMFITEANGITYWTSPGHAVPGAFRPNHSPYSAVFPTDLLPAPHATPDSLARQNRINGVLASMTPAAPSALIGETIVDLVRGNFPSLLKNFHSVLLRAGSVGSAKDWARLTGQSYLNSAFGWQPLIADIIKMIKVLTKIDNLVYGSATRRTRTIPWESQHFTVQNYQRVLASYYATPDFGAVTSTSFNELEASFDVSYDVRLSARYAALARPSRGANTFIDQVEDKIRDLGVWYPALGWDLLPYSWLVDWCSNLGAAITNAQYYRSTPGFTPLDYCWATTAMRVVSTVTPLKPVAYVGNGIYTALGSARSYSEYKEREPVSPFGFGIELPDLTSGQQSILVALGLARIR
jgi:hypothetical protein